MSETVRFWLSKLYETEIEEVKGTISNERLFEKGWTIPEGCDEAVDGNLNPHTQNIKDLEEYLETLESLRRNAAND